jgi:fibrillarin-like pre-rRNA processing protein
MSFHQQLFPGVWKQGTKLFTESLVPGSREFARSVVMLKGVEYREWDPYKSKACAALVKGLKTFPIRQGSSILYLGISSGSTASFFSDIIGPAGVIYGVEISERSMRDLSMVAEKRKNIVPILANAKMPEQYSWVEPVDVVYQDVATNDQSEILIRNAQRFLKKGGHALLAIKSRSIDVTKEPKIVFQGELAKLRQWFLVQEKLILDPYEKDHLFVVLLPKPA